MNDLAELHKDLSYHPRITQGQWVRILRTALEHALEGWPSEPVHSSQHAQPAQPTKPEAFDATLSKFQEMDKKLNAKAGPEVMEVAEGSQVLGSQVLGSQPMSSNDEAASDPPSDAEPNSKKAKSDEL